jgi:plasmid stabilization system protein ParE
MRYEFHQDALEEYNEATRWYADRDLKLAFRFIDAVEEAVSRVVENPTRSRAFEATSVAASRTSSLTQCSTLSKATSSL